MTWFERIKACQTPEEMAVILDTDKRGFCPRKCSRFYGQMRLSRPLRNVHY